MHEPLSKVKASWGAVCDNSVRAGCIGASALEAGGAEPVPEDLGQQPLLVPPRPPCPSTLRGLGLPEAEGAQERGDSLTPRAGGQIGKEGRQWYTLLPSYLQGES